MEQSETVSNLNEGVQIVPKTLKTLCTLSLIMSGIMILMAFWAIKKAYLPSEEDVLMQQQQAEMIQTANPEGYEAYVKAMDTQGLQSVITLVTQLISLGGIILMFKLKKTGFYLYVFGELIPYVFTIALSGLGGLTGMAGAMGETMQTVIWVVVAFSIAIDILFVALYAKQVKYMA